MIDWPPSVTLPTIAQVSAAAHDACGTVRSLSCAVIAIWTREVLADSRHDAAALLGVRVESFDLIYSRHGQRPAVRAAALTLLPMLIDEMRKAGGAA